MLTLYADINRLAGISLKGGSFITANARSGPMASWVGGKFAARCARAIGQKRTAMCRNGRPLSGSVSRGRPCPWRTLGRVSLPISKRGNFPLKPSASTRRSKVTMTTDRLDGKKLFLYTQKTSEPVFTVLPDSVLQALEALPRVTAKNYFWSGESKHTSIAGVWEKRLKKWFAQAGVSKGAGNAVSHRLRDTFAIELLLAGVPIERVSVLLGPQSVQGQREALQPLGTFAPGAVDGRRCSDVGT